MTDFSKPIQDPRYPGVTYLGDWGPVHPWHPVDSSQIREPMDFVRQVDAMGEWASAEDKKFADEIRRDPGKYYAQGGIVLKDSVFRNTVPRIMTGVAGSVLGAGLINAFTAPAAAASGAAPSALGTITSNAADPFTGIIPAATAIPASNVAFPHVSPPGTNTVSPPGPNRNSNNPTDFFTNPKNLVSLAPLIAMLAKGPGSSPSGSGGTVDNDFLKQAYADARRTKALQETRFRRVDPLHEAVTQLAFNRLPNSARAGISLNRLPLPAGNVTSGQGDPPDPSGPVSGPMNGSPQPLSQNRDGAVVIGYSAVGQPIYGHPDTNPDDKWFQDHYGKDLFT